jgi:opacity protein-like surface antigen
MKHSMAILLCGLFLAAASQADAQPDPQPAPAADQRSGGSTTDTPATDQSLAAAQGFGDAANWFCQLQMGMFYLNTVRFNTLFPGQHRFNTRNGWGASWDLMMTLPRIQELAVGLTLGYYTARMRSLTDPSGGSFAAQGDFFMVPLMATILYQRQLFNLSRVSFFAGLSCGLMYHEFDISSPAAGLNYDRQRQWNFAAGVRAGLQIRLLQSLSLIATYQYLRGFSGNGGYDGNAVMFGFSIPWGESR